MPSRGPLTALLLFLAFAFAVIGGSVGINALVKSHDEKKFVRNNSPPGVRVNINTNDVLRSGIVLTVACGVLGALALAGLLAHFLGRRSNTATSATTDRFGSHHPRVSRILAPAMLFASLWILATLIAFDVFARTRSAKVTAFAGTVQVPQSVVDQVQQQLGVTPRYWDKNYIHLIAIIPWIAVLFGVLASIALFLHARRRPVSTVSSSTTAKSTNGSIKHDHEKRDTVTA